MEAGRQDARSHGAYWGHVALVLGIGGLCVWYLADAARASPSVENLLLIGPAATLVILIGAGIIWAEFRKGLARPAAVKTLTGQDRAGLRTAAFMALMVAYVIGLALIAFDVATVLFAAASLYALGERRILFLGGFAVTFTVLVMGALSLLIPSGVPMLLPL